MGAPSQPLRGRARVEGGGRGRGPTPSYAPDTARTYIGHDDRSSAQLWQSLSYIRGGITEIGYFASWDILMQMNKKNVQSN